jgi:4-hydroxy-3-methylbut-2-enyl diphosphate reductase
VEIWLAQPRGVCAGVARAIQIVERALAVHGAPVYVFHEIVHNRHVVRDLEQRGVIFVNSIAEIPIGAITIFSAHGVSTAVRDQSAGQGLRVIDATCPMVAKVHLQAQRYARLGYQIVVVGHPGHEEVEGTVGSVGEPAFVVATPAQVESLPMAPGARVAYVTQTTLGLDDTREVIAALRRRWPDICGPDLSDICFATHNRQIAVRNLAARVEVVLVLGASNSSNSNRLREVAEQCGRPAYLIDDASQLDPAWIAGCDRVGVTAGASVPELLVTQLCERLQRLGAGDIHHADGPVENVVFRLPEIASFESAARSSPVPMIPVRKRLLARLPAHGSLGVSR